MTIELIISLGATLVAAFSALGSVMYNMMYIRFQRELLTHQIENLNRDTQKIERYLLDQNKEISNLTVAIGKLDFRLSRLETNRRDNEKERAGP